MSKSLFKAVVASSAHRVRVRGAQLLLASTALVLAGCAGMVNDATAPAESGVRLQGSVFGGQQPVAGATIQLYDAQTTGYGVASVALITGANAPVLTTQGGNFLITGHYTCPSASDQVYLVATGGGNPGAAVNPAISLMTALGSCSNLSSSTFISVNEATTVASVYALAGFMSDYRHVSTSSTNVVGLQNAFLTVNNLVNTTNGQALATTPAYATAPAGTSAKTFKSVVPQSEIYALANIIASCINTNGPGGNSTACQTLFANTTPPGGVAPTDTIQATLNIALYPSQNVGNLYALIGSPTVFQPSLPQAPNDWTIALNFIGGGLGGPGPLTADASPTDLAIDASGNIWTTNNDNSSVTLLNNQGAPLTKSTVVTPKTVVGGNQNAGISNPNAIAIDLNGNVYIGNLNSTISKLLPNGNDGGNYDAGSPTGNTVLGMAVDGNNNVWAVSDVVAKFNSGLTEISGPNGYAVGTVTNPEGAIAIDQNENAWVESNGNGKSVQISGTDGSILTASVNALTSGTQFAAINSTNNFLTPQQTPNSDYLIFTPGSMSYTAVTQTSISNPLSIAVDGVGHLWIINAGNGGGSTAVANLTELTADGSVLSGSNGYVPTPGFINSPTRIAFDNSGNLWLANSAPLNSSVTEFIGVGAPTIVPMAAALPGKRIGQRP